MKFNFIQKFDVGQYRIWKYEVDRLNTKPQKKKFVFRLGKAEDSRRLAFNPLGDFSTKKKALEKITELETKYVVSFIDDQSKAHPIEKVGTRAEAERIANILYKASAIERAVRGEKSDGIGNYRVNYSTSIDCVHYIDNQGLCHQCGLTLDEHMARESGYFQEEK